MNFMKDDLWREKTELLNLRLCKVTRAKVLLEPDFDTEDQVLFGFVLVHMAYIVTQLENNVSVRYLRLPEMFIQYTCI